METQIINIHHHLVKACLDPAGNDAGRTEKRKAQYELYRLYYKAMYNTALRIVNNEGEAEDIMQNSFLDAFSKLKTWSGTGTFGSWLKSIVVNNAIDAVRKFKDIKLLAEEDLEIPDTDTNGNLDETAARIEEVKSAMQRLSDEDRIILSLFLLEGYDHEEISSILGISYNATRTRYSRARQKLCNMLKTQQINKISYN